MLWEFLQRDSSTKIVQAPKLLALDNQEATVFLGETIRYARSTAATNQNGGLQFSIEEDPNSPVSVGFQLLVLPHVIPGEQKIMLTVIPQRRALSGKTSPLPGFDRISVSGQFIDLPRVQSTTLVTHMILRSGETALIGGLLEDREIDGVAKVPLLGDLPVLGLLFQGKESIKVKEQLLIMITPRILRGSDSANCTISDELLGRREQVNAEFCDMSGRAALTNPRTTGSPCFPPPAPRGGPGATGGSDGAPAPVTPMPVAPTR
jgi:general secretion pathway protein D